MRPDPILLENLIARPSAPEPRLALAEWYEQHGGAARAELIRADVALHTRLNPAQRLTLNKRVRALLKERAESWAKEMPGMKGAVPVFRRGLVEELSISETSLAEHGEEIFAREPVSQVFIEMQDGKGLAKAAGQPWFERIRWLKVYGKADAAARALAAASHAGKLQTLMLREATEKGIAALLGSESLGGLRKLSLTGRALANESLGVFSKGRLQLERLFMSACLEEGAADITPLVEAEWLRPLKVLGLNRNHLEDDAAEKLAGSKVLENLEGLELSNNELTEEGVLVFKSAKVLPRLESLDLSGMWYSPEELKPLRKRFGAGLKL